MYLFNSKMTSEYIQIIICMIMFNDISTQIIRCPKINIMPGNKENQLSDNRK